MLLFLNDPSTSEVYSYVHPLSLHGALPISRWGDGSWVTEAAQRGRPRLALFAVGAFRPRELMSGNHIGPEEAVDVYKALGAESAIGVHWGTFQLSSEAVNEPREVLDEVLKRERIEPRRSAGPDAKIGRAYV